MKYQNSNYIKLHYFYRDLNSITRNVPRYNFQAATNEDGERFYIKVSDRRYEPSNYQAAGKLLIGSFYKLKEEAEEIVSF